MTPTATTQPADTSIERRFEPFNGTPAAVPGRIEAEDYDTGGQGWAWFDRTPGNQGGAYRQDDVDIETGASGNVVAFVKSSEWLIYSVDVAEAGMYTATFRASSPWNDREVWVWVDGVLKAQVKVPNTGSFDTYEDATANVTLPAGSHYIRLQFVQGRPEPRLRHLRGRDRRRGPERDPDADGHGQRDPDADGTGT